MRNVVVGTGATASTGFHKERKFPVPQAPEIRQRLLDLVVDVDSWYAQQQELEGRLREANERAQRLDHERLGATLRLESELQRSTVEYDEKIEALEQQVQALHGQIAAQNQEIKDAIDQFARELEVRPDTLATLTVQAVALIRETKKMIRENL